MQTENKTSYSYSEMVIAPASGWVTLFGVLGGYVLAVALMIVCGSFMEETAIAVAGMVLGILWCALGWIFLCGLRTVRPNEAVVLTLFGRYVGSIKKEGFYFVNPFCISVVPDKRENNTLSVSTTEDGSSNVSVNTPTRKVVSLKEQVFDNNRQKVNDEMGNPIEVGIVVTWRVVDTAKAVFNVDNYHQYIQMQADSALRDVVRQYPYDSFEGREVTLRGDSEEISERIQEELQRRMEVAGIQIMDARITHLAYAAEIASIMLQRQQAQAIIEARQKIVEGAVGMVELALDRLSSGNICVLDDERRAQMVSNLLVVLCGDKGAQPVVNSGSIY